MNTWDLIYRLLGPGYLWGKTQQEFHAATAEARRLGNEDAVEHLQDLHKLRNQVMMEKETPPAAG